MKNKYLILLLIFILTGCFFGEAGSGYTSRTCTKETQVDGITLTEEKKIKQKDNNIVDIIITNKIIGEENTTFKSLKNSYLSELNNLKNQGIITNIISDLKGEYSVSYEFTLGNISNELKEKYEFEDLYHNQLKKYEKEGYKCK
ncbi:MAG: hypothetical protein E7165_04495 [Firmicutes bacterium]|nr:hypothetical protein [Bacillota bacterium]